MGQIESMHAPDAGLRFLVALMRWTFAGVCFLFALFVLVQLLGLLFIGRIADRADDPNRDVGIPVSVRYVGLVADRLHEDVLNEPLQPDGSNWPLAFRMFFTLELCGLAGICAAMTQLGTGALKRRSDWTAQARSLLVGSCLAMLIGILFLKLIR